ncbi:CBM35 domain-containing protein [Dactylosporangium sp. AC04546]|uniref:CBM35 domain-containing protein n=1 Tax=Dactylosporangium sp. AC04546 TaxID=2862460 RepID=UPI001EDCC95B|nr:CBM35 domain-containing protein [Dactylosporangium sp. AC04546]WVK84318.1 CBM35 domain-containing protein [Dactylosporangium sp. AC04546]
MTGDDGDTSRLRTGPWLPEPAVHTGETAEIPTVDEVTYSAGRASVEPVQPAPTIADTTEMAIVTLPEPEPLTESRAHRWPIFLVAAAVTLAVVVSVAWLLRPTPTDDRADRRGPEGDVVPAIVPSGAPSPTSSSPRASRSSSRSPSPSKTSTASRGPFQSISMEAESGSLSGGAEIDTYMGASGGKVVHSIGRSKNRTGSLSFTVNVPDAGQYVLTMYVALDGLGGSRNAVVTVGGGSGTTVATNAGLTCCTSATVPLTLAKGANTVTISNPEALAPSVDRVVVSAA